MIINKAKYGVTPDGQEVTKFTLINDNGLKAKVINFGASITELHVPDKNNHFDDIVLGFADLNGYLVNEPYFGCVVGRVANRIAKGKFSIGNQTYQLPINNGNNCLHGGIRALHKVLWDATIETIDNSSFIVFSYESKNGEEGFPGNLKVKLFYSLSNANELIIRYEATSDQATPVNLTNHSYFNLSGANSGNILNHELYLNADRYALSNDELIPTGKFKSVKGTPLDFTIPCKIGERINQIDSTPVGYDHSYLLNRPHEKVLAARVDDPKSGRIMEVFTTQPSIQLYTSNFLNGTIKGKDDIFYQQYQGFCLETQHLPDSVNQPEFPSIIIQPSETYRHVVIYKFLK